MQTGNYPSKYDFKISCPKSVKFFNVLSHSAENNYFFTKFFFLYVTF